MTMRIRVLVKVFITAVFVLCLFVIVAWVLIRLGLVEKKLISGDAVAVVELEGVLVRSQPFIDKIKEYRDNVHVRAVVLRIDSPGGGVGPAQEIYAEVLKLKKVKPVVASMGSVAASGGYYIACAAHTVVANPGTITGSIGVIIEFANIEELLEKIGLKSVVIKSGHYKDTLSPTRPLQPDERQLIQEVVDTIHGQFIDAVAAGRGLERDAVAAVADGRIFSGEQAVRLKLVDQLGNLEDAIQIAADMAGIDGEPKVVYPRRKKPSILDFLIEGSLDILREYLVAQSFKSDYLLR
jgi:protease IV